MGMGLSDLWYENAIIYCLDVETFKDSNDDGVGDFRGLTGKLDYLNSLGVTCIWLMPFFPTPNRDDGYDVADFTAVDPRYGSVADFVEFTREADERGMRVIIDLVMNHTSNEHPWFQSSRSSPDSAQRDFYVWRTDDPGDTSEQVVFPGKQEGIWSFDEQAQAWYLHHFYDFQPDLNTANPAVREELRRIMGLWLQLGVSGFRVDAAPFIINHIGVPENSFTADPHNFLRDMRDVLSHRSSDAIFLAEVDEGPTIIAEYFGGGNEFQLLFNFLVNRALFLALAQESADPLLSGMKDIPRVPDTGQWVNFLRHHDELNLSRLTEAQRQSVFKAFGADEGMQVYNRGLRRRLATMFGGNRQRLEMAYSLLFTLPGTPMIFYGEELGMGENLDLPERMSVRTPMPWSPEPNGGFSTAKPDALVRPMVATGKYGYRRVNVRDQRRDPGSLLNWMVPLIRARKECPEFGWGEGTSVTSNAPTVYAQRSAWDDGGVAIAVHNLSREACDVSLELPSDEADQLLCLFADSACNTADPVSPSFTLEGYGYRWLRVGDFR